MLRALEDLLNALSDLDAGWWPFLSLRPQKEQPIDGPRLRKLSLAFGLLFGFAGGLFAVWRGFQSSQELVLWYVPVVLVLGPPSFFVFYGLTFAVAWNRRAARLRAEAANKS